MNKIYVITGPAGVGKSTVSKKIASLSNKSALIEGDTIYHLVTGGYISPWKEGNHLKVFWKNCFDLIKNFLDEGYDVVFNYIINKKELEEIKRVFKGRKIKFVVLMADKEELIKRDKKRPEENQMKERAIELLENFKNENFNSENIIDTSNMEPKEVCIEIINNNRFEI